MNKFSMEDFDELIEKTAQTTAQNIINKTESSIQSDITPNQIKTIETLILNFFDTMIINCVIHENDYIIYSACNVDTLEGVNFTIDNNGNIEYYSDDCLTELSDIGFMKIVEGR